MSSFNLHATPIEEVHWLKLSIEQRNALELLKETGFENLELNFIKLSLRNWDVADVLDHYDDINICLDYYTTQYCHKHQQNQCSSDHTFTFKQLANDHDNNIILAQCIQNLIHQKQHQLELKICPNHPYEYKESSSSFPSIPIQSLDHCYCFAIFGNCPDNTNCKFKHEYSICDLIFNQKKYQIAKQKCDKLIDTALKMVSVTMAANATSMIDLYDSALATTTIQLSLSELYRFYAHIAEKSGHQKSEVIYYFHLSLSNCDKNFKAMNDYAIYLTNCNRNNVSNINDKDKIKTLFQQAIDIVNNMENFANNVYTGALDRITMMLHLNYAHYLLFNCDDNDDHNDDKKQDLSLSLTHFDSALCIVSKHMECDCSDCNGLSMNTVRLYCCIVFFIGHISEMIKDHCESIEWYQILIDCVNNCQICNCGVTYTNCNNSRDITTGFNSSANIFFSILENQCFDLKQYRLMAENRVNSIKNLIKPQILLDHSDSEHDNIAQIPIKHEPIARDIVYTSLSSDNFPTSGTCSPIVTRYRTLIKNKGQESDSQDLESSADPITLETSQNKMYQILADISQSLRIFDKILKCSKNLIVSSNDKNKNNNNNSNKNKTSTDIESIIFDNKGVFNTVNAKENNISIVDICKCNIIPKVASDRNGCIFLCNELSRLNSNFSILSQFYNEIEPFAFFLCQHKYGSIIICKFLEIVPNRLALEFIKTIILDNIVYFSLDKYGCHVIEQCLHCVKTDINTIQIILDEFDDRLEQCMYDTNGHQVIGQCFVEFGPIALKKLMKQFQGNVYKFSLFRLSATVMKKLIANIDIPDDDKIVILDELLKSCIGLSRRPHGSKVIQHCLQYGPKTVKCKMINLIFDNIFKLGTDMFGWNVVVFAYKYANTEQRNGLIKTLLSSYGNESRSPVQAQIGNNRHNYNNKNNNKYKRYESLHISSLVFNQFGYSAVGHILNFSDKQQRADLIDKLTPMIKQLKKKGFDTSILQTKNFVWKHEEIKNSKKKNIKKCEDESKKMIVADDCSISSDVNVELEQKDCGGVTDDDTSHDGSCLERQKIAPSLQPLSVFENQFYEMKKLYNSRVKLMKWSDQACNSSKCKIDIS